MIGRVAANLLLPVVSVNIDLIYSGSEEKEGCHGLEREAGRSIAEVMLASVNLSCQNVPARQKLSVEGNECRGQDDRREEIDGCGCLAESMTKGGKGRKLGEY